MVNYAQLRDLDTSKLVSAAEAAGGLSGSLSARGGEVAQVSQIPAGMWAGPDASAASGMMSPLSMPLYDVSDAATTSQGVITTLVGDLEKAKERLADAHEVIAGTGITISADGTVTTPVVDDPAVAAENDRKAAQARTIIDEAVTAANQADDKASGTLASVGDFFTKMLGPPQNSPLGPWATGSWAASQALGRFGNLASWMGTAYYGRFAPHGIMPNGKYGFLSPSAMSAWERAKAGANGQFRATPYKSGTRAGWSTAGKWAGRAGGVLGFATGAATQASKDWSNGSMSTTEKVGRSAYTGAATGGGAWAGGVLGAKVGAGIGTLIAPGVGTVVGGAIGGIVGGVAGSQAGTWIANNTVDAVGNGVDWAGDRIGDGLGAAGKALDKITPW